MTVQTAKGLSCLNTSTLEIISTVADITILESGKCKPTGSTVTSALGNASNEDRNRAIERGVESINRVRVAATSNNCRLRRTIKKSELIQATTCLCDITRTWNGAVIKQTTKDVTTIDDCKGVGIKGVATITCDTILQTI